MLPRQSITEHVFLGMTAIVASAPMRQLLAVAERVARSQASVLITGESGAGKEMIARAIHYYSSRSHRPWVDLSCAALPEQLLESELFGHEKGAFSGAESAKAGLFELAHQGTIFLDEIGELDPRMQVKLLRVLDGVPYYRLGGVRKVAVDVRVVAATNQDLERAVAEGRFRGDLYHRLCQVTMEVPALRHRVDDIEPLARHFLERHDPSVELSAEAVAALRGHPWPGNIRELRNTVVQAAVMSATNVIGAADLQFRGVRQPVPDGGGLARLVSAVGATNGTAALDERVRRGTANLDEMERRMIMDALAATNGHQQKAAAQLGISRRTLSRKLKLYAEAAEMVS